MPLGHRAIGEAALASLAIEPAPTLGGLCSQFRQYRAELLTNVELTPHEMEQRWGHVLDAIDRAISGRGRKVDGAVERYDKLVEAGWSTDRRHHLRTKKEAIKGSDGRPTCTVRALELALRARKAK